jgi:hypothetical protein
MVRLSLGRATFQTGNRQAENVIRDKVKIRIRQILIGHPYSFLGSHDE